MEDMTSDGHDTSRKMEAFPIYGVATNARKKWDPFPMHWPLVNGKKREQLDINILERDGMR
jgi:hypothetical protein